MDEVSIKELSLIELRGGLGRLREERDSVVRKALQYLSAAFVVMVLTNVAAYIASAPATILMDAGVGSVAIMAIMARVWWLFKKRYVPIRREYNLYEDERVRRTKLLG